MTLSMSGEDERSRSAFNFFGGMLAGSAGVAAIILTLSWRQSSSVAACLSSPKLDASGKTADDNAILFKDPLFSLLVYYRRILASLFITYLLAPAGFPGAGLVAYLINCVGMTIMSVRMLSPLGLPLQMLVMACMYSMYVVPIIGIIYATIEPPIRYALSGQTEAAKLAGFKEVSTAGGPPSSLAIIVKSLLLLGDATLLIGSPALAVQVLGLRSLKAFFLVLVASPLMAGTGLVCQRWINSKLHDALNVRVVEA